MVSMRMTNCETAALWKETLASKDSELSSLRSKLEQSQAENLK